MHFKKSNDNQSTILHEGNVPYLTFRKLDQAGVRHGFSTRIGGVSCLLYTSISDYLVDFAKAHGLKYRQDEDLNVIIWKDGSKGYEDSDPVILQGHMDMVAVKESDCDKDMEKEGLDLDCLLYTSTQKRIFCLCIFRS